MTDADLEVSDLALEMIEARLRAGTLKISRETVRTCSGCGHMTGLGRHECNACGGGDTRAITGLHLIAERPADRPVLDRSDIHASHRRQPQHLQNTADNVPPQLILSRTRDHGIDLSPLGFPGLVLDPRVGIHVIVLAVACRLGADTVVMTTTENAANHIAAYGQSFRQHNGTRLLYSLHGRIPYDHIASLRRTYEAYDASLTTFERWFLPLYSVKEKIAVHPEQLPALFKYFIRTRMIAPSEPHQVAIQAVKRAIVAGDASWITNKAKLADVITTAQLR